MTLEHAAISQISRSNFTNRLQKGVASAALSQLITIARTLLLVPLFLRAWGTDGYGHWLSLTALVAYVSLVDLGGQSYIGNLLAIAYARGELDLFRQRLSEGVSLFVFLCGTILILLVVFLLWNPVKMPWMDHFFTREDRWVIGCLGASYLISVVAGVFIQQYRATGLFARGAMVGNASQAMGFVILAGALWFQVSMTCYAAVFFGCTALIGLIGFWDIRRRVPSGRHLRLGWQEALRGRAHLKGSLYFWFIMLAMAINQEGVILVLSAVCPPAAIALYATHRAVAGLVRYPGSLLQSPLWPELSFLWGQGRYQDLTRIALIAIKLVGLASIAMVVAIVVGAPTIYPLWTGRHLSLEPALLAIFLVQAVLFAGWSSAGWVLLAANRHQSLALWFVANALVTIVLALVLAKPWGIRGVALASLLGDLACGALVIPFLASAVLRVRARRIFLAFLHTLLGALPLLVSIALLSRVLRGWWFFMSSLVFATLLAYPALRWSLGKEEISRMRQLWVARR